MVFCGMGIRRTDSKGPSKQTCQWHVCRPVAFPQKSESVLPHQKKARKSVLFSTKCACRHEKISFASWSCFAVKFLRKPALFFVFKRAFHKHTVKFRFFGVFVTHRRGRFPPSRGYSAAGGGTPPLQCLTEVAAHLNSPTNWNWYDYFSLHLMP